MNETAPDTAHVTGAGSVSSTGSTASTDRVPSSFDAALLRMNEAAALEPEVAIMAPAVAADLSAATSQHETLGDRANAGADLLQDVVDFLHWAFPGHAVPGVASGAPAPAVKS